MIHKPIEISRVSGRISLQKRVRSWLLTKAAVLRWLEASTTQSTAAAQDAALARAPAAQRVTAWSGCPNNLSSPYRMAFSVASLSDTPSTGWLALLAAAHRPPARLGRACSPWACEEKIGIRAYARARDRR